MRQKARRVKRVDQSVLRLVAEMKEIMREASGVGLAAPQVGVPLRIIVIELPPEVEEEGEVAVEIVLCNPEIVRATGEVVAEEACLSLPGWVAEVPRAARVTAKGLDVEGKERRVKAEGLLARALQHEIDHLDGVLFPDRVRDISTLKRMSETEESESGADPAGSLEAEGQTVEEAAS